MLPRRLMSTEVAEHVANWSRSKRTSRRASRKRICGDIEKPRVCQAILRAALAAPRAFHRSKNDHRWRRERWLLQWRKSCSNKAGTTLATPPSRRGRKMSGVVPRTSGQGGKPARSQLRVACIPPHDAEGAPPCGGGRVPLHPIRPPLL